MASINQRASLYYINEKKLNPQQKKQLTEYKENDIKVQDLQFQPELQEILQHMQKASLIIAPLTLACLTNTEDEPLIICQLLTTFKNLESIITSTQDTYNKIAKEYINKNHREHEHQLYFAIRELEETSRKLNKLTFDSTSGRNPTIISAQAHKALYNTNNIIEELKKTRKQLKQEDHNLNYEDWED